jgi:Golgi nucleoside diphosphatase
VKEETNFQQSAEHALEEEKVERRQRIERDTKDLQAGLVTLQENIQALNVQAQEAQKAHIEEKERLKVRPD